MFYRIPKANVLASVLALSMVGLACDRSPTLDPPDPLVQPPAPPGEVNYTISGVITEMVDGAPVPVEGADVWESFTSQSVLTDSKGFYTLPGIKSRQIYMVASKAGYRAFTSDITGSADRRLDIRFERFVTYTLSGIAYELTPTGRVPIAGIVLYCDGCGSPVGHTFVTTDAEGLYSFSWVLPGTTYIIVNGKDGYTYVGPAAIDRGVPVTTVGDTRFDFEFVRR